jgi:hypothetical protein
MVCVQVTLNGTTEAKPRSRAGRPKLPAERRPTRTIKVNAYLEDEAAISRLIEAGYGRNASDVLRNLARERSAELESKARTPEQDGRLPL